LTRGERETGVGKIPDIHLIFSFGRFPLDLIFGHAPVSYARLATPNRLGR
jgi:hypothetical protein